MFSDTTHIHHFLENSTRLYPEKHAVVDGNRRATYSNINEMANRFATHCRQMGIGAGNRIVLFLENSIEYIAAYYGILKAGAAAVPLNTYSSPSTLSQLIPHIEPSMIVTNIKHLSALQEAEIDCQSLQHFVVIGPMSFPLPEGHVWKWDDFLTEGENSNPLVSEDSSALASIIFTSGSSGKPKGVMLSHENIVHNTSSICQYLSLTEKDIQMVVLPFTYVMGKSLLNTHFAVGGRIIINNQFAYPANVLKQMVDERVTGFSGVPSTYAHLLHRSPLIEYRDKLVYLRYCSQAGGHMPRQTKIELRKALPEHTEIFVMYGATEASARLSYLRPDKYMSKIDSIGQEIPGVVLRVVDMNGEDLPAGKTGELIASGKNIMRGYWKDPLGTAKVLSPLGYKTGDMAYKDVDGYFFITGRHDNLLKVNGFRVNPEEVEDALLATGLIVEAAVIGIPDPLMDHKLLALTVPKHTQTVELQILQAATRLLDRHKWPEQVILTRDLPKNHNGKIDRNKCLKLVMSHID
ncbi:MAG: class I adenylate-forming enzyme family protein [Fibrobacterota bacterium]